MSSVFHALYEFGVGSSSCVLFTAWTDATDHSTHASATATVGDRHTVYRVT